MKERKNMFIINCIASNMFTTQCYLKTRLTAVGNRLRFKVQLGMSTETADLGSLDESLSVCASHEVRQSGRATLSLLRVVYL